MKTTQKSIALLLLASIASGMLASCGGGTGASDTTVGVANTTEPVETGPALGFEPEDNGGKTFTVLQCTANQYEYLTDGQNGDIVNDAIYNRNTAVEEYLGIKFEIITEPGNWSDRQLFNGLIRSSVMADDGAYDLVSAKIATTVPIITDGLFVDVLNLDYLELDKPWWIPNLERSLGLGGKLFGIMGDATLSAYKYLGVIFFDKAVLDSFKLQSPYELVRSGDWTIDKMIEMASGVSEDINGDGQMTVEEDRYGYISGGLAQRQYQVSTDMKVFEFGSDGYPFVTELSEHTVDTFNRLYAFLADKELVCTNTQNDQQTFLANFESGRVLFLQEFLYMAEHLRNMKDDFGFVPMPKADTKQEQYYSEIGESSSILLIPKTADLELSAKVCEALSFYSWKNVIPTYFEVALKEKYTRDDDVKEMIDIIRSTMKLDFAFAFHSAFSPFPNQLTDIPNGDAVNSGNIASYFASNAPSWEATLETIIAAYAENN